jgi:peptide/nickel transport system substrate-binding protein
MGGNITLPLPWTGLDPGNSAFSISDTEPGFLIFDTLFVYKQQSLSHVSANTNIHNLLAPELGTGYEYSKDYKTLTIQLRHGVKFQDGTAFNAAAVKFNLLRYQSSGGVGAPDMDGVTSITTKGNYTVVLHSSAPNANLLFNLVGESDGFMGSPTAIASEGAVEFNQMPVGAGGFKVVSDNIGVTAVLQRWPGYWNAKHTYLSTITFTEGPAIAGDVVEMEDLQSGAINALQDSAGGTPSVLNTGLTDTSLSHLEGPATQFHMINLNTFRAPFNNPVAREAVFECTDREALWKNVYGGYGRVAYIMAGPGSLYYPTNGGSPPQGFYNYNQTAGTALVKQLGGLSFTLLVGTSASSQVPAEALQSMWEACGMKVNLVPTSNAATTAARINGTMQLQLNMNGAQGDPFSGVGLFTLPGQGSYNITGAFGNDNATLQKLEDATNYTTNYSVLTKLWTRVYDTIDSQTLIVPLISQAGLYFTSGNLHGWYPWGPGFIFTNAWLS